LRYAVTPEMANASEGVSTAAAHRIERGHAKRVPRSPHARHRRLRRERGAPRGVGNRHIAARACRHAGHRHGAGAHRHLLGDIGVAGGRAGAHRGPAAAESPEVESLKDRYRVAGLPTLVVLDRTGKEQVRITEFVPAERFVKGLRDIE